MNEEQQIEEMANIPHKCIKSSCEDCIKNDRKCADYTRAEALYNAGYRKADEVRKETAEKIIDLLVPDCKACDENWHSGCLCLRATLAEKIAKQFGVGVEE